MDVTTRSARLRGLNTGWIEQGSGDDILFLIHGYPDPPLVWEHQIRYFSNRYQVVCPFVRGEGPSEGGHLFRYGLAAQSLDFLQMLREIDRSQKKSIVLVGHDLGAVHAWNLAPLLGKRLKSLVIFNGCELIQYIRKLKNPRQHFRSWYIYAMQIPLLPEVITSKFPHFVSRLAYRLGGLEESKRPETSPESIQRPLKQYRAFVRDIVNRKTTKPLEIPVLVVWGENDPFLENITANEFSPLAFNVTFRIVPRGHWHFRENPEETNLILESFFQTVSRA